MATVAELTAGDLVTQGGMSGVFITRGVHPIWPSLMLVIWRLGDGWSFDALDLRQEVGDVVPSSTSDRQERLRAALLGPGRSVQAVGSGSDEGGGWETVRAAAIKAVRKATAGANWPASDAEEVADAVLAVCGEEAVSRMTAQLVDETRIKAMDFRNGAAMDLVPSQTLVANWVAAAKTWLDHHGAVNYAESAFTAGDAKDEVSMEVKLAGEFERFAFILQRVGPGKLTPHEARRRAEAEVERLRTENEALRGQLAAGHD